MGSNSDFAPLFRIAQAGQTAKAKRSWAFCPSILFMSRIEEEGFRSFCGYGSIAKW